MTIDVITAARRRTRRLLIAVLAGVVLLAGSVCVAGLYATSRLEDGPTVAPSSAPAAPWPAATGAAVLVLPIDLTWVRVAGVALPASATAGPRQQRAGLVRGFAHTPAGAVLAAIHLLVRTTPQVGSAVFTPTLRDQVVGADADAMRAAVAADYRTLGGDEAAGGPVGSLPAALAGVRLSAYGDTHADVDLLTSAVDATGTSRFAATPVPVTWTGSDWVLVAPPQGRWDSVVRAVATTEAAAYPPLGPPMDGR